MMETVPLRSQTSGGAHLDRKAVRKHSKQRQQQQQQQQQQQTESASESYYNRDLGAA